MLNNETASPIQFNNEDFGILAKGSWRKFAAQTVQNVFKFNTADEGIAWCASIRRNHFQGRLEISSCKMMCNRGDIVSRLPERWR